MEAGPGPRKGVETMSDPIYLYRRLGQASFATCDLARYTELSGHRLFETMVAGTNEQLQAEITRLKARVHQLEVTEGRCTAGERERLEEFKRQVRENRRW